MRSGTSARTVGAVLGVLGAAAILLLTLGKPVLYGAPHATRCYLCEPIRLPDVIRNVALFVPLGAALGLLGLRALPTLAITVLGSAAIEAVQLWIPGRESSFGDVACNALGATLAATLAPRWRIWLRPRPAVSAWVSLAVAVLGAVLVATTGWLFAPSYTPTTWYAGWVPELGYLGGYGGQVLDARIGDVPLTSGGPLPDTETVRERLRAGAPIRVKAIAGPEPERLAPLLTIHDGERREMLVLGAERDDLVYRQRTRGAELDLEQPSVRLPGAFEHTPPGTPVEIEVSRSDGRVCGTVNGVTECNLGFSAGRGWATLFRIRGVDWLVRRSLDALWIAGIALPVALWWRPRAPGLVALALLGATVLVLPPAVGLLPSQPAELGGLAFGLALGFGLQRALRAAG